eukprot:6177001-Prymnesium_polylepis.1
MEPQRAGTEAASRSEPSPRSLITSLSRKMRRSGMPAWQTPRWRQWLGTRRVVSRDFSVIAGFRTGSGRHQVQRTCHSG